MKTLPPRYRKRRRSIYYQQQQQLYTILTKVVLYGTIIFITCIIGYYSIHIAVITIQSMLQYHQQQFTITTTTSDSLQENHHQHRLFDLSYDDINLWLDSTNEQMSIEPSIEYKLRQYMIQSCLPNDNCGTTTAAITNTNERIGIIRSPGLLGRVLEDYIQQFLHYSSTSATTDVDNTKDWVVIVQPNSNSIDHLDNDWTSFTKIIRPVVMPILLDVLDLMIQTTGDDYHIDKLTMDDMINTLRILIQWHCYIAQMGTITETTTMESLSNQEHDTHHARPMLSISLHHFMSFPYEINESMIEFLQFENYPIQQFNKDLQKFTLNIYAENIFHQIDTCTTLLNELRNQYTITKHSTTGISSMSFTDMLNDVIQNELNYGYCTKTDKTFDIQMKKYRNFQMNWNNDDRISSSSSRVIEIINTIFVENTVQNICINYPKALICNQ